MLNDEMSFCKGSFGSIIFNDYVSVDKIIME